MASVGDNIIEDFRVPRDVGRPNDMGKGVPFSVGVGTKGRIWKAVDNINGVYVVIVGNNTLITVIDFHRAIMDGVLVVFKLTRGVYRFTSTGDSILM